MSDTLVDYDKVRAEIDTRNEVSNSTLLAQINNVNHNVVDGFNDLQNKLSTGLQIAIGQIKDEIDDKTQTNLNYMYEKFTETNQDIANIQWDLTSLDNYVRNELSSRVSTIQSGVNQANDKLDELIQLTGDQIQEVKETLSRQINEQAKLTGDKIKESTLSLQSSIDGIGKNLEKELAQNAATINYNLQQTETRLNTSLNSLSVNLQSKIDANEKNIIAKVEESTKSVNSNIENLSASMEKQNLENQDFISGVVDSIFSWVNNAFSTDPETLAPVLENYMTAQNKAVENFMKKHPGG